MQPSPCTNSMIRLFGSSSSISYVRFNELVNKALGCDFKTWSLTFSAPSNSELQIIHLFIFQTSRNCQVSKWFDFHCGCEYIDTKLPTSQKYIGYKRRLFNQLQRSNRNVY